MVPFQPVQSVDPYRQQQQLGAYAPAFSQPSVALSGPSPSEVHAAAPPAQMAGMGGHA